MTPIYYKRVMFFSCFNAGVRAVDIRDPFNPKEIGYYIPAITKKTAALRRAPARTERCKIAIQTNNVEVDDRGYIYIVDRANTGMHILELTGRRARSRDSSNTSLLEKKRRDLCRAFIVFSPSFWRTPVSPSLGKVGWGQFNRLDTGVRHI